MNTTSPLPNNGIEKLQLRCKVLMLQFNTYFNRLSLKKKRISVILFGVSTACLCLLLIVKSFLVPNSFSLPLDKIKMNDELLIPNKPPLTPLGKFLEDKKEVYVAVDKDGRLYSNYHPDFSEAYRIENGWEAITTDKLDRYNRTLQFIPFQMQVEK